MKNRFIFSLFLTFILASCGISSSSLTSSSSSSLSSSFISSVSSTRSSSSSSLSSLSSSFESQDSSQSSSFSSEDKYYTVTWMNYDGSILDIENDIKEGEMPQYKGRTPTKPHDVAYSYTFKDWEPALSPVICYAIYTATYESVFNKYVISWVVEGEIVSTDEVEYGSTPVYKGETPTKPKTDEFFYEFVGWDPEPIKCYENATYVAQFSSEIRYYDVT